MSKDSLTAALQISLSALKDFINQLLENLRILYMAWYISVSPWCVFSTLISFH